MKRLLLGLMFVWLAAALAMGAVPPAERAALVALYEATNGPDWIHQDGWLGPPGTECDWHGVTCDKSQTHVTIIRLTSNQLRGPLPDEIGQLTFLETLDLQINELAGTLPRNMANLTRLKTLALSSNHLAGPLPAGLGALPNLENLLLARNELTGPWPAGDPPPHLRVLDLTDNPLGITIPKQIKDFSQMTHLILPNCRLSGAIPAELGLIPNLAVLDLSRNQLTGSIPSELGLAVKLSTLDLSYNRLTGSIPMELGNLRLLWRLSLNNNALTGKIPTELGQLTEMMALQLGRNRLHGSIPVELVHCRKLSGIDLTDNNLSGIFPAALNELPQLFWVHVEGNRVEGVPSHPPALLPDTLYLDKIEPRCQEAERLAQQGRWAESEPLIQQLMTEHPDSPRVYHALGIIQYYQRDRDAAVAAWERAIDQDPAYWPSYQALMRLLLQTGDVDGAEALGRQHARVDPNRLELKEMLFRWFMRQGEMDKAREYFDAMWAIDPTYAYSIWKIVMDQVEPPHPEEWPAP